MAEKNDSVEVKFLTSLALSVNGIDDEVKHLQFSIVQEVESKEIRAYFDVIDPTKAKLKEVNEDVLP